jgi:hypothetical protein
MRRHAQYARYALAIPLTLAVAGGAWLTAARPVSGQEAAPPATDTTAKRQDKLGYQDTPLLPGGKWHVHDGLRPQPPVVDPGPGAKNPLPPPADAIVLFDGTPESAAKNWRGANGKPTGWQVENGALVSTRGSGYVFTRPEFGDAQYHIEFATPTPGQGSGQGRGNSGVFLMGRYEIQVLDSYGNQTYPDGQCAAVYGQSPPLVNASRRPGEWQTYDIAFTAPRFNADKTLASPAYVTVLHNGILVQANRAILGETGHRQSPKYTRTEPTGPLGFQDHGNPVRYRNIWVRPLPASE